MVRSVTGKHRVQGTTGHRGELGSTRQKDWVFDDLNHEDLGTSSQARAPLGVLRRKNNSTYQNMPKKLKDDFPKVQLTQELVLMVREVLRAAVLPH